MSNVCRTELPTFGAVVGAKVLVVDDEKSIRCSLSAFLEAAGYDTDIAEDASVAQHRLADRDYDVVVTDIILPGVSGVALLEQIRASSPAVQVIMMTGEPSVGTASAALRAGAFDYLVKPVGKNAILRSVLNAARVKSLDDKQRLLENANRKYQEDLEEIVQDRTAKLQEALSELQQAQKQLIQQERMSALGQMASGIAHDFNNVLMPILGLSDYLLSHRDVLRDMEDAARMLETINSAARDAKEVVRRLREFYRPSQSIETGPVDLKQLVEYVLELSEPRWKSQAQAQSAPINVHVNLLELPPVQANEPQMREVFMNIVLNAVDAMHAGGLLRVTGVHADGHVTIQIHDTGVGMSPDVQARCLEPFFTTKAKHGTGLGLSLCHGIVKRHEGTLTVQSEVGEGTSVIVRLPTHHAQIDRSCEPAPALTVPPPRPLRVLAVDDEELSLMLIETYLQDVGHKLVKAGSAEEAIAKLKATQFDLLLTDRAMPGMGGDQVAKAAKQLWPDIGVIMLTGFGELMEAPAAQVDGVDRVVAKPVTQEELLSAIKEVMHPGWDG